VVERELAIRSFVPEDYLEVVASFRPTSGTKESIYQGRWFRTRPEAGADKESLQKAMRLPIDGEEANRVVERARTGKASIESIESETQRIAPPALYDLTELQRHANRLFGFSAQKTLDLSQALYERHKLISYPRTDSRHLSRDVAATLPLIVQTIEAPYREHLAAGTGEHPLGRRFVDDSKVTDHHAIIPTTISPEKATLTTCRAFTKYTSKPFCSSTPADTRSSSGVLTPDEPIVGSGRHPRHLSKDRQFFMLPVVNVRPGNGHRVFLGLCFAELTVPWMVVLGL
jgi:DNA topoisomerase-3